MTWQPISTHNGGTKEVLGINAQGDIRKIWFFAPSSNTQNWLTMDQKKWNPTHWMPLPEPPSPQLDLEDAIAECKGGE